MLINFRLLKTFAASFLLTRRNSLIGALLALAVCESSAQDTTALLIINNVPIVIGAINDRPAYFLIDTGASVTILNESLSYEYNFKVVHNKYFAKGKVTGLGGRSFLKEARAARVTLGSHKLDFINRASNLDLLSAMFADRDITIAGIIGTDLLHILGSKIDLSLGIIVFKLEKQVPVMDLSHNFVDKK